MKPTLHVFALTKPDATRHTHLTRSQGTPAILPPLASWLGADLDTGRIDLFPLGDLGDMPLSAYLATAYEVERGPLEALAPALDDLSGSVLLVPSDALSGVPAPGPQLRLAASLPMARPDHGGTLPRADPSPAAIPPAAPIAPRGPQPTGIVPLALGLAALLAVLVWWFGGGRA